MSYLFDKREKERNEAILKMNLEKIPEYYKGIFKDLLKNHMYYGFDKEDKFLYSLIFQKYSIKSCSIYTNADEFYNDVQRYENIFNKMYQFKTDGSNQACFSKHKYYEYYFEEIKIFDFEMEGFYIIFVHNKFIKKVRMFIYDGLDREEFINR